MRISTNTMFQSGSDRLSDLQSALQKTQQQLSTGRRVVTPSDDPIAAAQALDVTQAQSVNDQFGVNRKSATSTINQVESTLGDIGTLLENARTLAVSVGNVASMTDADRASVATQLSDQLDQLISLANSDDGRGSYLFSGYQTSTQPFTKTVAGAQYNGDQGQRLAQVGPSRQLPVTDSGNAIFEKIKTVVTAPNAVAPVNIGNGTISAGSVVNAALVDGHSYSLNFTVAGGVTTYDVVDSTSGTTLSSANPYNSGQQITVKGFQFSISGIPANSDKFTISSGADQSVFKALTDFVSALKTPGTAAVPAAVASALGNIDQAIDTALTVRSAVGSHIKEIEDLNSTGDDRSVQYSRTLSGLQDLDYAKSISEFTQQQQTLEAAQKSFMATSGLSLFKLL